MERADEALVRKPIDYDPTQQWLAKWRNAVGETLLGGYATGPHTPQRPWPDEDRRVADARLERLIAGL